MHNTIRFFFFLKETNLYLENFQDRKSIVKREGDFELEAKLLYILIIPTAWTNIPPLECIATDRNNRTHPRDLLSPVSLYHLQNVTLLYCVCSSDKSLNIAFIRPGLVKPGILEQDQNYGIPKGMVRELSVQSIIPKPSSR